MESIGFIVPLVPDKTETARAAMLSCWRGHRRDAYQASRRRLGITREAVFIQPTPGGDVAVVYWEAEDVATALKGMGSSDDPFRQVVPRVRARRARLERRGRLPIPGAGHGLPPRVGELVPMRTQRVGDFDVIRDAIEVPGLGALAINAFVVHAEEAVLVDTGRPVERESFLAALRSVIEPAELQWIWLTHPDRDHMGALFDVLALAPDARLVTTFMAAGYLTLEFPVPFDRVQIVNPGESLAIGPRRRLHAFRPPIFDSPMTVGFFDDATSTCISSDCFGGLLPSLDHCDVDDIGDLDEGLVRNGQLTWAVADSLWVRYVDRQLFAATYGDLVERSPELVLSTHLPPAAGRFDGLLDFLDAAPSADAPDPPDHACLRRLLEEMRR